MVGAEWDKAHKKAAIDLFRLVQIYMGDRKARPGMTLNSVAQDILHATFANEKWVLLSDWVTERTAETSGRRNLKFGMKLPWEH